MIDKFRAHFGTHSDWSKSSRFEAFIFSPPCMGRRNPEGLRFQCETAELPGYNINTVEGKVYGAHYASAATPVFNDLNLTFICAGDMWEKKYFDDWMEFILPKNKYDFTAAYRKDYVTTIEVKQYDETSGQVAQAVSAIPFVRDIVDKYVDTPAATQYHVKFLEIFPTSVAPIALNWAADDINRLNVTFKYRYWNEVKDTGLVGQFVDVFKNSTLKF